MLARTLVVVTAICAVQATAGNAETLKYSFQGPLTTLDPYTLNEAFTLSALGNTYEGLVRRDENLKIEPALAESWEALSPTHWRFHLRKGVKFHNGNEFTAQDVVFSMERATSQGSNLKLRIPDRTRVVAVDDHTVDFVLETPNPILTAGWENLFIMDEEWTIANGAEKVTSASDTAGNHATLHANGTGPFRIVSHEPGVKTVYKKFDDWWDTPEHNLNTVEFMPISSDATRVAALLAGAVDLIYPVPVQDLKRIQDNEATKALTGPELRTIFLGMDQLRDEPLRSSVKGKNPFKDVRVRKAFYQAIDIEAIKTKIMRDLATPTALMVSPFLFSKANEFQRHPYDPDEARALLAEAGYEDGFSIEMNCPNDRYVNDEAICQAVTAMLARVGIKIYLVTEPKAKYFGRILSTGGYDTSFYLLGWTPSTFESHEVLKNLMNCRDGDGGTSFNIGGWCDERVDALTAELSETVDQGRRDELIAEAFKIAHDNAYIIPLHQQSLAWGVASNVDLVQRPDNQLFFRFVRKL
ncbi:MULTISPECIES: ABC transporter substrate-binding protein [unclassified Pannonibacter]|uniref:ABC transporter substrate-binding protein n=1 Tax=unclassified Pannonibacter TaxID=2627228 RepID=UPI001648D2AC|nr:MULTISPECIES: ABC transporter substrate-binding protein [unclassified Pannonibacter]